MSALVARCPHCGQQHPREVKTCPATGQAMPGTLALGETLGGNYRVLRYLCEGGLGALYEAEAAGGVRVTIEVAHPDLANDHEALSHFYEEARVTAGPSCAQVFDAGRAGDGSPYLVIEPLHGTTLAARLEELGGRMPAGRAAHIVRQVLEAVAPLHRLGIAHRGLGPEHVFLTERDGDPDQVKVLDFGFGRLIDGAGVRARAVAYGYPLPYFLAPEQTRNGFGDARADIYACGALLYRLITGQPPHDGRDVPTLMTEIVAGRVTPPRALAPDVPPALEEAMGYALAFDPGHRYQSAEQFIQTLAPLSSPASITTSGREKTRPSYEHMTENTDKSPSKAIPIVVGFVLAGAVLGVLLAVRNSGKGGAGAGSGEITAKPTDPTEKPKDPVDKPPDKPPDNPPVAAETPDAASGGTVAETRTPDAGSAATVAETKTPDAGSAATVAENKTPDAGKATVAVNEPKPDAGGGASVTPPKPKPAVLSFNVTPKDAKVTVDGKPVTGKVEIPPGAKSVKVAVSAPGYVAWAQDVQVKGDDNLDIQLKKEVVAATPKTPKPTTSKKPKKPKIDL